MKTLLTLDALLRRREAAESALPGRLAVAGFAVATCALLVTLGGWHAFVERAAAAPGDEFAPVYVVLASIASVLLVVPIVTLGSVAARLVVSRRDARLAALRLVGATSAQVGGLTILEQARQACVGALLGALGYVALLPVVGVLAFQRRPLGAGSLWLGPGPLAAVLVGVVALAVVSGMLGLARVVVSPLGVARRSTPARVGAIRVVVAVAVVAVWVLGFRLLGQLGTGVTLAVLAAVVFAVDLVGPYVVMLAGAAVARLARTPATLLAARRIVDDPRATWRCVSALGLGIGIAALSSVGTALSAGEAQNAAQEAFGVDVATGSLVALAILAVVAATSTGVVQAARVFDQRDAYRALSFAGAPTTFLHRARLREVTIPLGVTVALGAGFPVLLLLPLANLVGPGLFVRMALAIGAAAALLVGAVLASAPLVRRAASVG